MGLMLVNRERNNADKNAPPENFRGGLGIYDVTKPTSPREITRWGDRRCIDLVDRTSVWVSRTPFLASFGVVGGLSAANRELNVSASRWT